MALDTDYAKARVQTFRELVAGPPEKRDDSLSPEDRNILIQYDEQLTRDRKHNDRCGWYHHANTLSRLFVYAQETGQLAACLKDGDEGEQALDQITDWIHSQDYGGYSLQGHLSTIRVFAETILGELPERFEEIEPGAHVEEDPAPLPSNIVEYSDAIKMVVEVDSFRDKALILTQWSAGFRPMSELYTLQRKNVEIFDDHAEITLEPEGKTNRRSVILVVGSAMLRKWIEEEHPVHDDPEASMGPETFIWTKLNKNKHLCYGAMAERFTVAGDRAELEKDYSGQHLRRSAASVLAGQPYISERDLRQRFNWSPNSDAPEHYIAANSAATKVNVAMCRGRDVDGIKESPDTAPVLCPSCGDWTTRGLDSCIWCTHDLDDEQATFQQTMQDPRDAGEKDLAQMLLDGDVSASELRTIRKLEAQIKTERDLFEQIDDYIVKAEALEDAHETGGDSVSSLLGVTGLVGWASATVGEAAQRWTSTKHAAMTIHPGLEDYPPSRPRLAGVLLGWLAILSVAIPLLIMNSIFQDVVAGEPTAVLSAIIAAGIGLWLVHRDMPSLDEALDAAASE
ncbi:tyrosine-type recombinase/integrase [Haloarcula onubensis]|uniref:Tyrosine-type recombinase/integrase n=1 Tax=Haloarcula onubensis TaxID=2950539 RepID=A0ABU2FW63_9EURY|nr:tyrosine-type recombinase/integrase [Halomicroarcula sp. S3CR25-11]MDS0284689.1 tyrosine-type recombinase/integrase [Halomicroarcula sp. S3CR25-11]